MRKSFTISEIRKRTILMRRHIVQMAAKGKTSHVGSALSCVDLLAVLYFRAMNIDPKNWDRPNSDRFILSKGHGVMAWYAALAERGFIKAEILNSYALDGSPLGEHPGHGSVAGITVSTGSLGHGLSVGVGMAIAKKMRRQNSKVFVLLSDGECNEGSVWEAAMYAAHRKLDNLIAIIDDNKMQAMGKSTDINAVEPLGEKWRAFGWGVKEIDGHNISDIVAACKKIPFKQGKPSAIVAHTLLGKGVSFMEDRILWHYQIPSEEQLKIALSELK